MPQLEKDNKKYENALLQFLNNLKALVRTSNAVCMISVDQELISNRIQGNLEYLGDIVLKLTSFKEHQELKIGEYDGTIKLLK